MNKTELIEKIAAGSGLKKAEAKDALDATLRELKNALVAGEKCSWSASVPSRSTSVPSVRVSTPPRVPRLSSPHARW